MSYSISLLKKNRCKTIETSKYIKDDSPLVYLYRTKSRFTKIDPNNSPSNLLKSCESHLPSFQTSSNLHKEISYQSRLSDNLNLKKNETLREYRIRLRTLLDSQFSAKAAKPKTKSPETRPVIQLKLNKIGVKKKIKLIKPAEEKPKQVKLYRPRKDPYFFGNISKGNFTSFVGMLNVFESSHFPYLSRANKEPADVEFIMNEEVKNSVVNIQRTPIIRLKKVEQIREEFAFLENISQTVHKADLAKTLIINIDCVFYEGKFLQYAIEALRLLSGRINLVLILNDKGLFEEVFSDLRELNIEISGFYVVEGKEKSKFFLDYSSIFNDFHLDPSQDCLVFTCHNFENLDEVGIDNIVGKKLGSSVRLYIEKIPLICCEFPQQPVVVLMNRPEVDTCCGNLRKITDAVINFVRFNYPLRAFFEFQEIFKDINCDFIESCLPYQACLPYRVIIDFYNARKWSQVSFKENAVFKPNYFII